MENTIRLSTSNWRSPVSGRLERIPDKAYPSPGYGMMPIKGVPQTAVEYFMSASRVKDLVISGRLTLDPTTHLADLKRVAYMFDCAQAAHRPSWFVLSQNLGYPSHLIARVVAEQMALAQEAIINGDDICLRSALDVLHDEAVPDMLENYLLLAKGVPQPVERGFAYLAWTADGRPELAVGAAEGGMPEILEGLRSSYAGGDRNWGILGAWLVHDPEFARASIGRSSDVESGGFNGSTTFLHQRAKAIQNDIEEILISTSNLILSPWHVDDELAFGRLGIEVTARVATVAPSRSLAM